jgi:hypothetical protein
VSQPKILLLDIETAPTLAYVWKLYKENISVDQIVTPTRILCWSGKFLGKSPMVTRSEWGDGRTEMLVDLHKMLNTADAVVTYNGDHFDLPKIQGAFVEGWLAPTAPIPSIDLYKTVRKLGYQSGKLAFVAPYLGIGGKVKHEGFRLWRRVLEEDPKAEALMLKYNKQDVLLLERLYQRLRPFIKKHPYLGEQGPLSCPACGSNAVQRRGTRRTRTTHVDRLHCQKCGHWSSGASRKVEQK